MSETAKTLAFMAAGAVALLAAFFVVPSENTFDVNELVGQELNQFEIDAPKRLKIIKYDGDTATAREFEVAEENGLWRIPSKQGYPADATQQMADAATCLMDREILRIAATSASEHARLGVIDPTAAKLTTNAKSVGTRVIMSDNNNAVLTDMIVGKKVKDAEGQYFVRNTNQDVVYVVDMDPKKLSTKFDDWIEDDLLKINPFDIRKVSVKDYTAEMMLTLQGFKVNWDRRAEMTLTYDSTDAKWNAESLKKFDTGTKGYVDYKVADDEELNAEALNKLRDGLDDLLIVDVERKPASLSADLKGGADFIQDQEAATSLMSRGFAPVAMGVDKQADILSTEGEVVCSLQDGVEYVLRFGNLQMEGDGAGETGEVAAATGEEEGETEATEAPKKSDDSINRYLFVMARFNEDMIEKPELEELPELPADAKETETGEGETASETEPATEGTESEGGEPASAGGEAGDEVNEKASDDSEERPEDPEADAKEKELADIIAARKEIEQENQRRLDEYQDKIKKGKETVAKLNERFGDWYYVISNDVYQQVHLGLDKVVKKKEAKEGEEADKADAATGALGLPNLPFAQPPAAETPTEDTPAAETPAAETPAVETPAAETPAQ